ncbi:MAG TPA: hypothetical protein PLE50_13320, partial [Rhabdaerophilum sp.]|nr:hypothetical protein [Rhabdaerophilum sp.]
MRFSPRDVLIAALTVLAGAAHAQNAAPDKTVQGAHNRKPPSESVRVENHTQPETCAEKDNIDIRFVNPAIRRFRIQAIHPAYIGTLREDL